MDFLERSRMLLGAEGIDRLKNSHVAVFGIGGVGGHITEALCRTGIGRFTLIDPDTVSITNLNRQIIALHSTLGQNKAEVMKRRILEINPDASVATLPLFVTGETIDRIDFSAFDYVIDAIDTMSGKLALAQAAKKAGCPLIAAMGAGNKKNPAGFIIADLSRTDTCPLARSYRVACRKLGITSIKVAYSKEPAVIPLCSEETEQKATGRPVCGSLAYVPAVMGLTIAAEVIDDLIQGTGACPA